MKKKLIRVIGLTVLAALLITTVLMPGAVAADHGYLHFYGIVTLDGQNISPGALVTASINSPSPWSGSVFVFLGGGTSLYSILIPAIGRNVGDVVHFTVNIQGINYTAPDGIWQTPQDDEEAVVNHPLKLSRPAFLITTDSLPDGQVGVAYSATLEATGGPTPYNWSADGLPAGLTLLSVNDNLTWTTLDGTPKPDVSDYDKFDFPTNIGFPVIIGDFDIDFNASDSISNPDQKTLTLSLAWRVGDANGDGVVNIADVTYVELVILGLAPRTPGCDANQDGNVNIADVTMIELMILGLVP